MAEINITSGTAEFMRRVRAWLEPYDLGCEVRLGWREPARQNNQGKGSANRIVFFPGDGAGRLGRFMPPIQLGELPVVEGNQTIGSLRQVASMEQVFTCCVWAKDTTNPDDEEAQIIAVEMLYRWAVLAIYHTGLADMRLLDMSRNPEPVEKVYGAEYRFTFVLRMPIFDVPYEMAFPEAGNINRQIGSTVVVSPEPEDP